MIGRHDSIRAAGLAAQTVSDHVIDCFMNETNVSGDRKQPPRAHKSREYYNPPLGKAKFNGVFDQEELGRLWGSLHGKSKGGDSQAADILNPRQTTWFNHLLNDISEGKHERSAVGNTGAQTFDPPNTGSPSKTGEEVGDLLIGESPSQPKLEPGKQVERGYSNSFDRDETFGVVSQNKTIDGENGRRGMEMPCSLRICDRSLARWRDLNKDKLSTTHDPIRGTAELAEGFTFGIASDKDNMGVAQVLHQSTFCDPRNLSGEGDSLIADLRKKVRDGGFKDFGELARLLRHSGENSLIGIDKFLGIMNLLRFDLDDVYLGFIVEFCGEGEGQLNVGKIMEVIDYRGGFHTHPPLDFSPPRPHLPNSQQTSYSQYISAVEYGGLRGADESERVYGLKTIRSDLTPPATRKASDFTSYGDELNVKAVLNPSVFANWGLSAQDLGKPMTLEEVRDLMGRSEVSGEAIESIFARAAGTSGRTNISEFLECYYESLHNPS